MEELSEKVIGVPKQVAVSLEENEAVGDCFTLITLCMSNVSMQP